MIDNGDHQTGPLLTIVGPTGVGKSEIAIFLAERLGGEIVSADSRLFYRGMDIGTAKPSINDRQRVPHYLIDVANPDETWSLAVFQQEADRVIREILTRRHLPILVGGTGQFITSVTKGWLIPAVEPNPVLRQAITNWSQEIGPKEMHTRLAVVDRNAAETIDYRNVRRTIRALEVIFSTGRRFSDQKRSGFQQFNSLMVGLICPRVELYQRIDDRIDQMIALGLVQEVQHLLDLGYSPELPTMSAIGYAEIISYLRGDLTLEEAKEMMKRRTRDFVRRQANWFKLNDPDIRWYQAGHNAIDEIEKYVRDWILSPGTIHLDIS